MATAPTTSDDLRTSPATARPQPSRRLRPPGRFAELVYVLPLVVLVVAVIAVPLFTGVYHSFTDWQPGYESPWVGFANFTELWGDSAFRGIVANQLFYLLGLPLWVGAPLILALLVHERVPGAALFRTVFLFPAVLSPVVIGVLFGALLQPDGAINALLGNLGVAGLAQDWLGEPTLVKPVVILVLAWAGLGVGVVLFAANLSTVPQEYFEAARLDGAGWWGELRHVVLPHLRPTILVYVLLQVINIFLWSFPWIYTLTQGGPGDSSATLDFNIYERTLRFGEFGPGAAEGVTLLLLVAVVVGGLALLERKAGARW